LGGGRGENCGEKKILREKKSAYPNPAPGPQGGAQGEKQIELFAVGKLGHPNHLQYNNRIEKG